MDERFADAAPEDLESDNVCIICREEMTSTSRNKKLTCGHVFHLHCLRYLCLNLNHRHFCGQYPAKRIILLLTSFALHSAVAWLPEHVTACVTMYSPSMAAGWVLYVQQRFYERTGQQEALSATVMPATLMGNASWSSIGVASCGLTPNCQKATSTQ